MSDKTSEVISLLAFRIMNRHRQISSERPGRFWPGDDENMWFCECGNNLFYITDGSYFCPNCGREWCPKSALMGEA